MFKFSGCSRKLLYSEPKVTGVEISFAGNSGENSTEKRTKIIVNFLDRKPLQFFRVLVECNFSKDQFFKSRRSIAQSWVNLKFKGNFPPACFEA